MRAPRGPRGQMAGSLRKPAESGRTFCLRGCACGWSAGFLLYEGEEKVRESSAELSPIDYCLAAHPRGPSGRALLGITRPQRRFPRLWTPPLPRVQPPFYFGSVVQYRITPLHFQITGKFTKLVSRNRLQYALRRGCSGTCQTFQLRRGKECSGKMLDLALTPRCAPIATTES